MKRVILSAFAAATLVAIVSFVGTVQGQNKPAAQGLNKPVPGAGHKVALIDMAYVFKNYEKFDALREGLKVEITRSDEEVKSRAQKIQSAQAQLKALDEGSDEYASREKQLLELTSDFEVYRKGQQREFFREESKIYKTIYLEVSDAVAEYVKYYPEYSLVLRFNREDIGSSDNPQEVMQRMNRQVVYYKKENDITDNVLRYLNREYEKQTASSKRSGVSR